MIPTIGRIVTYTNLGDKDGKYPPENQAAIVTGVYYLAPSGDEPGAKANELGNIPTSMFVDLKIFYRSGLFDMQKVPFAEKGARGHWHWPVKV